MYQHKSTVTNLALVSKIRLEHKLIPAIWRNCTCIAHCTRFTHVEYQTKRIKIVLILYSNFTLYKCLPSLISNSVRGFH